MARTRSIIKQEINGYVEDIYNDILEHVDDELEAMSLARTIGESTKDYTLDLIWDVLEKAEIELVREMGRRRIRGRSETVVIIRKIFRYWQR